MTVTIRRTPATLALAALAGVLLFLPQSSWAAASSAAASDSAQQDSVSIRDAEAHLNKSQFNEVKVAVDNGIATLTGTVKLYEYKADAEKRVLHSKGIQAVRNLIQVGGPNIPDRQLQDKLVEKLTYDRVGYGNAFNAISVRVQNGVVTLGGHARTYPDRDSAIALVNTTPGVKDVVTDIEVDPVSLMDDQIRIAVARAIYGYPMLQKYSIDPAKPIRISVQNGHVSLYGMVDNKGDRDAAFLRANGVPGVFSVKDYLQVANQPSETNK
ncbi:MAG TPA: BON domain-containing protein [Terracidiphilus sp.]|nr:BON domain-containing protein [Terracidiphilus sp.]